MDRSKGDTDLWVYPIEFTLLCINVMKYMPPQVRLLTIALIEDYGMNYGSHYMPYYPVGYDRFILR